MFGATFLVPVLTGFPPATTLLFSGAESIVVLIGVQRLALSRAKAYFE